MQELAGALRETRGLGEDALARLGRLDSALEETGRRVELSRRPGEEAVELLRSTAKVTYLGLECLFRIVLGWWFGASQI